MEERHEIKWGGFAGLAYAILSLAGFVVAGTPPGLDESAATIRTYFTDNQNQVLAAVLLTSASMVALVAFGAALTQALRDRMRGSDVPTLLISGVVLLAGLITMAINVFAALAYTPVPGASLTAMYVFAQVMFTSIGIAASLPLVAASIGIAATGILPRWVAWTAGIAAVGNVVGAFGVFNQTGTFIAGGVVMSMVPYLLATAWVISASAYMVREHLPSLVSTPQALGHT